MSKPDWTALAARYGVQEASYNALEADYEEMAQDVEHEREALEWIEQCPNDALGDEPPQMDLLTLARAHHDAGAAQDGQATVRLALAFAPAVALVIACLLIVAATFGAAWVTDLWTMGLALRGGQ